VRKHNKKEELGNVRCLCLSICFERELLIPGTNVSEVVDACHKALRDIGLKMIKEESTKEGQTTAFAGEGRLVPLITKTLLSPFGLDDYVRAAQRSGVHIVISADKEGVRLYACGIALNEVTGKLEEYTEEDLMEEVTDTLEAWDFEDKFINKISAIFPKTEEIK
jgi:hypothetical protein